MGCMELSSSSCAEIGVPIYLRRLSQGISWVAQRKPSQLSCMIGNRALLWSKCMGIFRHFKLIWATPSYFTFLWGHQCPSRLVKDFWGSLCSSAGKSRLLTCLIWNKALHCTQCMGIGPHLSARRKFHGFSRVAEGTWGTFSSYGSGNL